MNLHAVYELLYRIVACACALLCHMHVHAQSVLQAAVVFLQMFCFTPMNPQKSM